MKNRSDRRRSPRFFASATTIHHIALSGRLLNVSGRGIGVESRSGLRVGASYRLHISDTWGTRTVEGIVRWCQLRATHRTASGDSVPVFVAGLELTSYANLSGRNNTAGAQKDPRSG